MNVSNDTFNKNKLSKLQARKLKQSVSIVDDQLHFLQSQSPTNTIHNGSYSDQIADERSKDDKQRWLSKLHEENQLLLQLLDDLNDSKNEMQKRLKELEYARETIKSLKSSVTLDAVDRYILSECQLVTHNRTNLNFSVERSEIAEKVYERMIAIASRFKTNYSQYQEFLMKYLVNATQLFLDNCSQECDSLLTTLENITVANPFNFEAVQYLNSSLEKALFSSTAFNFEALLTSELVQRRKFDSYIDPKQSTGPSREYSAEQIERILIQNETLKQSVKELHDRLTQIQIEPIDSSEVLARRPMNFNSKSNESSSFVGINSVNQENNIINADKNSDFVVSSPASLQPLVMDRMRKYILQVLIGHPLSSYFSEKIHHFIVGEVAEQVQSLVMVIFGTYFSFELIPQLPKELQTELVDRGNQIVDEEYLQRHSIIVKLAYEMMDKIFQLSHVHAEIMSRVTMFLAYIQIRVKIDEE